ncbi:hypothetical protein THZG08_250093 [Vibrio owensii]|nr:hypothetical protein THZG08_250093 [Vibrio owensii]CAH1564695.1 hypothetical protein THOA03_260093 [Vibrio owensii]
MSRIRYALAHNVKHLFKKCIEINQSEVQTNFTGLTRTINKTTFLYIYLLPYRRSARNKSVYRQSKIVCHGDRQ